MKTAALALPSTVRSDRAPPSSASRPVVGLQQEEAANDLVILRWLPMNLAMVVVLLMIRDNAGYWGLEWWVGLCGGVAMICNARGAC